MISIFFYGTIIYLVNKYDVKFKTQISSVCIALMVLVGISRIYLGVHYATDVIGGYLLAGALLLGLTYLFDKKAGNK
jgi:undecaprenyl-diphosphatase